MANYHQVNSIYLFPESICKHPNMHYLLRMDLVQSNMPNPN